MPCASGQTGFDQGAFIRIRFQKPPPDDCDAFAQDLGRIAPDKRSGGADFVTTDPTATMLPSPISTPGNRVLRPPMKAFSPMRVCNLSLASRRW